jgi:hypothetical protein
MASCDITNWLISHQWLFNAPESGYKQLKVETA